MGLQKKTKPSESHDSAGKPLNSLPKPLGPSTDPELG